MVNCMISLELWNVELKSLAVLVPHPSGVVWANQVGGVACLHPQAEGLLVFLPVALAEPDPLQEFGRHQGYDTDRVMEFLTVNGIAEDFEPLSPEEFVVFGHYLAEAWVPVKIRGSGKIAALDPFQGRMAILTYENSD